MDATPGIVALASPPPASRTMHMSDAWELVRRWDQYLLVGAALSEVTRRQYRRALVGFLADVCKDPRQVTEDDVVAWLTTQGHQRAGSYVRALHSFYGWAVAREAIAANPVKHIKTPRRKYQRQQALSSEQLGTIMRAARQHRDPRVAPTLELILATGARVGSVCGLEPGDADLERGWVTFRTAKNDDPYGIPLSDRALAAVKELMALEDYAPRRGRRRPTLVGVGTTRVEQWFQEVQEAAGIRVHPHKLRHAFITELAGDPSVPLAVASRLANHKDPRVTLSYVDHDEGLMRAALVGR